MSLTCQYTIMSPTASSSPATQQPSRLNQRRNAMANVMDGVSDADISLIRVHAPACLSTARPTCVSTADPSSPRRRSPSTTSDDSTMGGSSTGGAAASGLAALAYQPSSSSSTSTSPLQSPNLKLRRNAMADALADIDQGSLSRIRAAHDPSSQHDREDDLEFTF